MHHMGTILDDDLILNASYIWIYHRLDKDCFQKKNANIYNYFATLMSHEGMHMLLYYCCMTLIYK